MKRKVSGVCVFLFFLCLAASGVYSQEKPELAIQSGHADTVESVSFSPNGKYIASGSDDNTIRLWDIEKGICIKAFIGHKAYVSSVSFSPEGKYIASGSGDATIRLWDIEKGICVKTFEGGHASIVLSVSFSPEGKYIASGSGDATIRLWDIEKRICIKAFEGHTFDITSVSFSPDGKYIASGSGDKTIRLWDIEKGICVKTFEGHTDWVNSVSFSPDGRYIASGSGDKTVRLWDIEKGICLKTFESHDGVLSVSFSPDGRYIASGSGTTIRLWDIEKGICIKTFKGHIEWVTSVSFSPDGRYIASGSGDKTVRLWDIEKGICIKTFEGHTLGVLSVSFSPDGRYIASGSGTTIRLWDIEKGICIKTFEGHTEGVTSVSFSPDGRYIASGSSDHTVRLWDAEKGVCLKTFEGHTEGVTSVSFSPNGKYIASGSSIIKKEMIGNIKIWDIQKGACLKTFEGHTGLVSSVSFSPDEKYIASGSGTTIKLWDIEKGVCIKTFRGRSCTDSVLSVSFSPDGRYIASGSRDDTIRLSEDYTIRLWDVEKGKCIKTFEGHTNEVQSVSFSPDGKYIASGSSDYTVRLWDIEKGVCLKVFEGHTSNVSSVSFSPNGKYIASGSYDGTIKIWDTHSGTLMVTLLPLEKEFMSFTDDNYYLSTKNGAKFASWRVGMKVYPFEQFDLKYNRPDIVIEKLGCKDENLIQSYKMAYNKRLKKMGFKEEDLSGELHLPEVKIDTHDLAIDTDKKVFDLKITAQDNKYNLNRINVYINDVPVFGTKGISLKEENTRSVTRAIPLELSNGSNKIQVSALNEKGAESYRETLSVNYSGEFKKPDLYVVSIGTSKYKNIQDLRYAAKDAGDLVELFKEQKSLFYNFNFLQITDEDSTRENILKAKEFLNKSKADDTVVLFVAGHGMLDKNQDYYYCTYDVNPKNLSARGIAFDQFEDLLDGIPARQKVFCVDTCFSGEVDKAEPIRLVQNTINDARGNVKVRAFTDQRSVAVKPKETATAGLFQEGLFNDLRRGTGAVVISASSGDEYSYEGDAWQNGVFTYSIIEGLKLRKADGNNDQKINISELRDYVTKRVSELTADGQHPTIRRDNIDNDFVIYE